jgi:p21-activated kinase 1
MSQPNLTDAGPFHADPSEAMPNDFTMINAPAAASTLSARSRSGTTSKSKKNSVLGFIFSSQKRPEISTPYDPVHLTHVGFNSSTGEFTGLPKEWQQLLQESGISRSDQEKNPQAVMEIVKFYQEGHGDVWDKLGQIQEPGLDNPVSIVGKFPTGFSLISLFTNSDHHLHHPRSLLVMRPHRRHQLHIDQLPLHLPPPRRLSTDPLHSERPPSLPHHKVLVERTLPPRKPHRHPLQPTFLLNVRRSPGNLSHPALRLRTSQRLSVQLLLVAGRRKETRTKTLTLFVVCSRSVPMRILLDSTEISSKLDRGDYQFRLQQLLVLTFFYSASGGVYTAYQVGTNTSVAIKQMDLDKQPKKDLIINEILVMRSSRHPNIVNYIDSFLYKNDLWVIMEYMEGGSLTDVVTANLMTEGQIAAVSRETAQGLEHLHRHGVIHRDIKSDNVLLSLVGDIKLSALIFLMRIMLDC